METLDVFIKELLKKEQEGVDILMIKQHLPDLLDFLVACQTCYYSYKLQKKPDPENIITKKLTVRQLIKDLTKLSVNPDLDFFDVNVVKIIDKNFNEILSVYQEFLEQEKLKPKKRFEEVVEEDPEPTIEEVGEKKEET